MKDTTLGTLLGESLDLSPLQFVVVDSELIDESHERTPSLMVTNSRTRQPVPGQKTSPNGHVTELTVDIDLGLASGRVIGACNVSPFIYENKENEFDDSISQTRGLLKAH